MRCKLVTLLPKSWIRKLHDIVDFQVHHIPQNYRIFKKTLITIYSSSQLSRLGGASAVADLCTLNGRSFDNSLEAGAYICKGALTPAQQVIRR